MKRKTRSERILNSLLNGNEVFNTKLARRIFAKERQTLSKRRFDSNVMRIARDLRMKNVLTGTNGQFRLN